MKKYLYVNVEYTGMTTFKLEEHRAIIDRYASDGYRFVGYIPTKIIGYGKTKAIDLIFEKDC